MNNTKEVEELAKNTVPPSLRNHVLALLATYHNTLLKSLGETNS